MAVVSTRSSGLGIDPATAILVGRFGYAGLKKLFGRSPPEKPFPWRWDRPGREVGFAGFPNPKPGYFGIIYMTRHKFYRVWEGSVWEVFDTPGFDISGTIEDGTRAWHAFVKDGKLQVFEDFGKGWVPTFAWTRQQLIEWTYHIAHGVVGPITRPAAAGVEMPIVAAGFAPDLSGATVPLLIAAGLALVFMFKK